MEYTSNTGRSETGPDVAEANLPQLQRLCKAAPTAGLINNDPNTTKYIPVSIGSVSTPPSSFPKIQSHSSIGEELNAYYGPQQLGSGIAFESQPGVDQAIPRAITIPVTTIPSRADISQVKAYSEDIWKIYKPRIRQLYIGEGKKLAEVMQQMKSEHFHPSIKMYKTHFTTWGFFKNNREKDVATLLKLKHARDVARKPSVIFRSGKPVDIQQINRYLRRKTVDPHALIQVRNNDELIRIASHICVRTPSPVPESANLLFPPGNLRDKEMILLNINQWYTIWVHETSALVSQNFPLPRLFHSGQTIGSCVLDSMFLLLQRGLKLFQVNRFAEGGTYVRNAFVLVDTLFRTAASGSRGDRQQLAWIFRLWKLVTELLPHDISRLLMTHILKMAQKYLPGMHPLQEILCCLCRVHNRSEREVFAHFIYSTWTDAIDTITRLLDSSGSIPAVCLPHNFWREEPNGHLRQFQEIVMESWREETIESWQQREEDLAFPLCARRQLFHASPSQTGILTLMWLRHSVVDGVNGTGAPNLLKQNDKNCVNVENCVVKTAILTRLELSVGKENYQANHNHIRVLSGDVYQVGHLHQPRPGEDIEVFKERHSLDTHGFERAKNIFQNTGGAEMEKGTWFKWLQTLEDSLSRPWSQQLVQERQRVESIILHKCLRGTGFICDYMATKHGGIGIMSEVDEQKSGRSLPEDDSMDVGVWISQH